MPAGMIDSRLLRALGDYEVAGNGKHLRFNCPFCLSKFGSIDTGHRLYYSFDSKKRPGIPGFFCHRCKTKGYLKELYQYCGILENLDLTPVATEWVDFYKEVKKEEVEVRLPEGSVPLPDNGEGYKYMLERGFTADDIRFFGFLWSPRLLGRVIIPDYDERGDIWFWTARSIYKKDKLRYLSCTSADTGKRIYRYYYVKKTRPKKVIICEGPIDAGIAGYDAVCTYGVVEKGIQAMMLAELDTPLLFAVDGDATMQIIDWCEKLVSLGVSESNLEWVALPLDQDPASMGRDTFRAYIQREAKPYKGKMDILFCRESI